MVGIAGGGGGGGGGYNYVQDPEPADPSEGEEWYDTGANAAYVYDGSAWVELTVVDHGQLSSVGTSDHHTRYSDSEARSAVSVSTPSSHSQRLDDTAGSGTRDTLYMSDGVLVSARVFAREDTNTDFADAYTRLRFNFNDGSNTTISQSVGSGNSGWTVNGNVTARAFYRSTISSVDLEYGGSAPNSTAQHDHIWELNIIER